MSCSQAKPARPAYNSLKALENNGEPSMHSQATQYSPLTQSLIFSRLQEQFSYQPGFLTGQGRRFRVMVRLHAGKRAALFLSIFPQGAGKVINNALYS
jgi:hypothetical protein